MLAIDDKVQGKNADDDPDKKRQGDMVQEPDGGFICSESEGKYWEKAPD